MTIKSQKIQELISLEAQLNELKGKVLYKNQGDSNFTQIQNIEDLYHEYFSSLHDLFLNEEDVTLYLSSHLKGDSSNRRDALTLLMNGFPTTFLKSKIVDLIVHLAIDGNQDDVLRTRIIFRRHYMSNDQLEGLLANKVSVLLEKLESSDQNNEDFYYWYVNLGALLKQLSFNFLLSKYINLGVRHPNADVRAWALDFEN